ncbi:MAG: UDP-N-acetylglucosamine 1-carboxyvinyltransferase, partial [Acidimicrobiia bacterium]
MNASSPEHFVVRASGPLHGSVRVGGAKNSVLKLMAATVLTEGTYRLTNVPHIIDVEIMSDLLVSMGANVIRHDEELEIVQGSDCTAEAPYELVEQMR